jgi:hypothetical protein
MLQIPRSLPVGDPDYLKSGPLQSPYSPDDRGINLSSLSKITSHSVKPYGGGGAQYRSTHV